MSMYSSFALYYDKIFSFKNPTYLFLADLVGDDTSKILDIGCGTGDYLGKLAEIGHNVTGIDVDQEMISLAIKKYPDLNFKVMDMNDVHFLNNYFDVIYSIGNVVSYLSKDQIAEFLRKIYAMLNDNGIWMYQAVNWDNVVKNKIYTFPVLKYTGSDLQFFRKYKLISDKSVIFSTRLEQNKIVLFKNDSIMYPHLSSEIYQLHKKIGFNEMLHFGDYQKSDYNAVKSTASILICHK